MILEKKGFLRILQNRFAITFVSIVLVALTWVIYVKFHNDGIIKGQVIDEAEKGVPNATVIVQERTIEFLGKPSTTTTDLEGKFVFTGQEFIELVIRAEKPGYVPTVKHPYHLYFKGQNFRLPQPLVLKRKPDR